MTPHHTNPWDRRPGESSPAYTVFLAYRDLGPDRSIDAAWVVSSGQQGSNKRATGRFTKWSADYAWHERAMAWDAEVAGRKDAALMGAVEKHAESRMERMLRERDETVDRQIEAGKLLRSKGLALVGMPVREKVVEAAGKAVHLNPADPAHHRTVAMLLRDGFTLSWAGIERGLAACAPAVQPPSPAALPAAGPGTDEIREMAEKKLRAWQAEQRARLAEWRLATDNNAHPPAYPAAAGGGTAATFGAQPVSDEPWTRFDDLRTRAEATDR